MGDGIGEDSFDDIALLGEEGDYPAHFEDVGLAPRFVFHKGFPEGSNNDDDSLFRVDGQVEPVELEIEGAKAVFGLGKVGPRFFCSWHGAIVSNPGSYSTVIVPN